MKITNPTNDVLEIKYKGVNYSIPAKDSKSGIPDEVAKFWKESIHEFIILSKEDGSKNKTIEVLEEVLEEVEEVEKEIKKPKNK